VHRGSRSSPRCPPVQNSEVAGTSAGSGRTTDVVGASVVTRLLSP
jgi:hypothetical protein